MTRRTEFSLLMMEVRKLSQKLDELKAAQSKASNADPLEGVINGLVLLNTSFSTLQIAAALNRDRVTINRRAAKESWPFEGQTVRGGTMRLYKLSTLPIDVQRALLKMHLAISQKDNAQ